MSWHEATYLGVFLLVLMLSVGQTTLSQAVDDKAESVSTDLLSHASSLVGKTGYDQFKGLSDPQSLLPAWNAATVYPTTIVRYAFADDGENFYVIGGVSNGTRVANVNRYNTGTGVWTPLAPIPAVSEAPCAAMYNGKIYVAQGDTGAGFFIYDIAGNSWSAGPNVPVTTNRYGCAAGAFNGKVYVVGGSSTASNSVQVYDIALNSWTTGNNASSAFFLAGYTQINQNLYVVGGFSAAAPTNLNTMQVLDMSTGTWRAGPAFTPQRADFALANIGGKMYAIGGDTNGGGFFDSTTAVDVFDSGSWASSPDPLPSPRQGNQAGFSSLGVLGGEIWSTGGLNGSTFAFLNEHLYRAAPVGSTWNAATVYPTTIVRYAFADDGENFYIIGGVSGGTRVANVNRYNTGTGVWTPLAPIPAVSEGPCAALLNGKIYVAQGYTGAGFFIYDIAGNSWSAGPNVPVTTNRYGCAAGASGGKVYIVGGSSSASNSVQVYDIASNTWAPGNNAPNGFFLAGYTQINQFLYVVGGFSAASPTTNLNTTLALNMTTGAWITGPTFTPQRADFALANIGNRLYAIGGDTNGGGFFDSTTAVDVFDSGVWASSPAPLPSARQGNQAGFNSLGVLGGEIWSTGGLNGATFTFLNEHLYRAASAAPTVAHVSVSGRVLSANGEMIPRAIVTRTGSDGAVYSARTNNFGNFTFYDVRAGETYIFEVSAKGFSFAPRVVTVQDNITDLELIGQ